MTTLNLSTKTAEAAEPDKRAAELDQQHRALANDAAELRRLKDADERAKAIYQQARNLHGRTLSDPDANIDANDGDRAGAAKEHRAAREAAVKAAADLAAHVERIGDMEARARELSARGRALEQARTQAAHKALVARKVRAALELEVIEQEEQKLVRDAYRKWPDGLGLITCTFPEGIFTPAKLPLGVPKSVFRDDVVRTVGVVYPDLLSELFPVEEVTEIAAAIEGDRARGVMHFAAKSIHWVMCGGWHTGGIAAEEMANMLRGPIRREHHGL